MPVSLRVLIVEDFADDAELIVLALQRGGWAVECDRVETAAALQAALARGSWDIVLSDNSLPEFGAAAALEIVRACAPDLPFVVVSGTLGDETAAEMIRAGANDYVLKDNLGRLVATVRRTLEDAANWRARRAAERDAQQLAAIVQSTDDAVMSETLDGAIATWNPGAERMFGWTTAEIVGRSSDLLVPPNYKDELDELKARLRESGQARQVDTTQVRKDGVRVDVQLTVSPIRDALGGIVGFSRIARDIGARKRAEGALRASEEALYESNRRFEETLNAVSDLFVSFDRDWNYTFLNEQAAVFTGHKPADLLGQNVWKAFPYAVGQRFYQEVTEAVASQSNRRFDAYYPDLGRWYEHRVFPHALGVSVFSSDVTEKKQAAELLHLRDRAIEAAVQGIVITDPNQPGNPIVYASPGFERITGYSAGEVVGRNCRMLQGKDTDPAAVNLIREKLLAQQPCAIELLNYRKDGSAFWNNLSISPVRDEAGRVTHFVGVQTDVTERRQMEDSLRQTQRMETVGQLAGGVAHDFNNLLTIIKVYCELLLDELAANETACALLREIKRAGDLSAELTRRLLAFSRRQVFSPQLLNLNDVVADTEKMLRRLIREDIEMSIVLAPELGVVRADPGQIEQVLLNLVVNASDALPAGGRLKIVTRNIELDGEHVRLRPGVASGPYIQLSVSDNGCGMTSEIKARIFEPFFTTKEPGLGTGLGLSTVYGIVQQSGGHIEVESEPLAGSTFRVLLPRISQSERQVKVSSGVRVLPKGTETILLVEDDEGVRMLIERVLGGCGYKVLATSRGHEAVELATTLTEPIDLLLTDVVLPGLGGRLVAQKVAALHPQTRVLFVSGYADDALVRHEIIHQQAHFLQKPFSSTELAAKVREVLDAE